MSASWWDQGVNWIRGNWLYLAVAAGGFLVGWLVKALDPPDQIPEMPEDLKSLTERVAQEWRNKGYPEDLIQDAIKWAFFYTRQIVGAWTTNEQLANAFFNSAYPTILKDAGENYILGRLLARVKEEKVGDIIGLK